MLGPKLLRGMSSQTTIPATEDQLAAAKASLDGWMCVLRSMRTILKFYMVIVNSFFQEVKYPAVPPLPQLAGLSLQPEVP